MHQEDLLKCLANITSYHLLLLLLRESGRMGCLECWDVLFGKADSGVEEGFCPRSSGQETVSRPRFLPLCPPSIEQESPPQVTPALPSTRGGQEGDPGRGPPCHSCITLLLKGPESAACNHVADRPLQSSLPIPGDRLPNLPSCFWALSSLTAVTKISKPL